MPLLVLACLLLLCLSSKKEFSIFFPPKIVPASVLKKICYFFYNITKEVKKFSDKIGNKLNHFSNQFIYLTSFDFQLL